MTQRLPRVTPIATADYPTPARRPANSRLDCSLFVQTFGLTPPPWRQSVDATTRALVTAPQLAENHVA
jgi:dTDP-4-dehydrorhamnose reductase